MPILFHRRFILTNLAVLVVIKTLLAPSGYQLASLVAGDEVFSKADIVTSTNTFRATLKLQPLKENIALTIAAAQKLQDMVQNQYFSHVSPAGVTPWHWFEVNRYSYVYAGENLAIGFFDASSTVDAWSRSSTHRANLVNPNYRDIGVAVQQATIKEMKGIVVVQLLGAPSQAIVSGPQQSPGISVGISQSGAQSSDGQLPPAAATTAPRSSSPVAVGTPLISPSPVTETRTTVRLNDIVRALNKAFVLYSLVITLLVIGYAIVNRMRRDLLLKTAAHIGIFLAAVIVPVSQAVQRAFIA